MKSLNSIFKNFRKTMAQLDKYVEKTNKYIERNEERMYNIQSDNIQNRFDREKATIARSKIAELIGEDE